MGKGQSNRDQFLLSEPYPFAVEVTFEPGTCVFIATYMALTWVQHWCPATTPGCLGEPRLLYPSLFCSGNGMPGHHPFSLPQLFWSLALHSIASFSSFLVTYSHQQTSSRIFRLWKTYYKNLLFTPYLPSSRFLFNNLPTYCFYFFPRIHTSVSPALVPVTRWNAHCNFINDLHIARFRNYFSIPIKLSLSAASKPLFNVVPQFLAHTWYVAGTQWTLCWWFKEQINLSHVCHLISMWLTLSNLLKVS